MKIKYDDSREIDAEDLVALLSTYAKEVLLRMQKADPEFADCWTACSITFKDLNPDFEWGGIKDLDKDAGIWVEVPLGK